MAEEEKKKKKLNLFVIILNVILVLGLITTFLFYDNNYKTKLYDQNVDDIANINQASANIASAFFSSREAKLKDVAKYAEDYELGYMEFFDFISKTNTDTKKQFELIGKDNKGYCSVKNDNGEYIAIDYSKDYGQMQILLEKSREMTDSQMVSFAPEFTDNFSAMNSFALYNCIDLKNENGEKEKYTLLLVSKTSEFIDFININSGYKVLATAIIDEDGNYIIGNKEFKSDNFFRFISVFNDINLDKQNEIKNTMKEEEKGDIVFKDSRNRNSVFVYTPVKDKNWLCISTVPIEYFHNNIQEFYIVIILILIMFLLFVLDIVYYAILNRRLKISAENEKVASIAKTTFLSQMSHEIRTPMNAIIGMANLAQDTRMSDETKNYVDKIQSSGKYLLDVLNDILDMSRIESGRFELHPEWVNAREMIQTCMNVLKPEIERKNIEFAGVSDKHDDGIEFYSDQLRMKQIIINLLNNAIKFTPEGGKISIKIKHRNIDNSHRIETVTIADTGCGMSEEFLKKIFNPFEQEQNKYSSTVQGTGLGLALVKKIITAMGGTISVKSKLGKGSEFTYKIPVEYRMVEKTIKNERSIDESNLEGVNILLVEDHPLNREIAIKLLEKRGINVISANNGSEGVKAFEDSAIGYFKVILMDIRMPVMTGIEATTTIRELEREDAKTIPIIAMTANAFDEDKEETKLAGMNAHLAKPIEPKILYKTIEEYL